MKKFLIREGVQLSLRLMASLARLRGPAGQRAQSAIEAFGDAVGRWRKVRRGDDPTSLGATWQRAFPAKKQVPIVRIDETTAYGEIHTECPLRGSGDLEACHRMMAYDRGFMRRAGARFVVLRSQAEPGVTVCQIAIRDMTLAADDLVPAHLRATASD